MPTIKNEERLEVYQIGQLLFRSMKEQLRPNEDWDFGQTRWGKVISEDSPAYLRVFYGDTQIIDIKYRGEGSPNEKPDEIQVTLSAPLIEGTSASLDVERIIEETEGKMADLASTMDKFTYGLF